MPVFGLIGLHVQSYCSPGSFYLAFVILPLLELKLKPKHQNLGIPSKAKRKHLLFFDVLLYLNIPVLYGLLIYFFYRLAEGAFSQWELWANLINMGILLAVHGINVAHELGHRSSNFSKLAAQILLLPSLYMHFTDEHNHWHHKYVATHKDPSSARINEALYSFWMRSIIGVYKNAWKLENRRLSEKGLPLFHKFNRVLLQSLIQLFYLIVIYIFVGVWGVMAAFVIALISICMLETINYIEHYGLQRKPIDEERIEPVSHVHSWNSDHPIGRIFLYELTRHPYHHLHAQEKYQNLDSIQQAPQLPFGYPACMLMALVPNLWFSVMNKRLRI